MPFAAGVCLLVAVVIGAFRRRPWPIDMGTWQWLHRALGARTGLVDGLLVPTDPWLLAAVIVVVAAVCAGRRQWADAAFVVAAVLATIAVDDGIMKPIFVALADYPYLPYPSGHTAGLVAVVTVIALLVRPPWRWLVVAVGVVATIAEAVGMIAHTYHLLMEIVGGSLVAVGMVLLVRWLELRLVRRATARAGAGDQPSTVDADRPSSTPERS